MVGASVTAKNGVDAPPKSLVVSVSLELVIFILTPKVALLSNACDKALMLPVVRAYLVNLTRPLLVMWPKLIWIDEFLLPTEAVRSLLVTMAVLYNTLCQSVLPTGVLGSPPTKGLGVTLFRTGFA